MLTNDPRRDSLWRQLREGCMIVEMEVRNADASGLFLFVCEHASNALPEEFGNLGLDTAAHQAHVAWDPGALGLARGLADALDSPLVAVTASRLVYDCNRPPGAPGAICERSEVYDIPGNRNLDPAAQWQRIESVYLPFQAALTRQLSRMLVRGPRPVLVTVHSFSPHWYGKPRAIEFGIIHDTDPRFALALLAAAHDLPLEVGLNAPYSAADGVAHTLKLHATPHELPHAMLEIRNDLIADAEAQADMAARLAPLLARALEALTEAEGVA